MFFLIKIEDAEVCYLLPQEEQIDEQVISQDLQIDKTLAEIDVQEKVDVQEEVEEDNYKINILIYNY